ncbi:hypothetical protein BDZ89DRAFT_1225173 [Hymenopellis radicata]|nr:hypothetical protein BDZ89DRAFT_1225173 [Hymenopellis radicata]
MPKSDLCLVSDVSFVFRRRSPLGHLTIFLFPLFSYAAGHRIRSKPDHNPHMAIAARRYGDFKHDNTATASITTQRLQAALRRSSYKHNDTATTSRDEYVPGGAMAISLPSIKKASTRSSGKKAAPNQRVSNKGESSRRHVARMRGNERSGRKRARDDDEDDNEKERPTKTVMCRSSDTSSRDDGEGDEDIRQRNFELTITTSVKRRGYPGDFIPGPDIPGIPCPGIRSLAGPFPGMCFPGALWMQRGLWEICRPYYYSQTVHLSLSYRALTSVMSAEHQLMRNAAGRRDLDKTCQNISKSFRTPPLSNPPPLLATWTTRCGNALPHPSKGGSMWNWRLRLVARLDINKLMKENRVAWEATLQPWVKGASAFRHPAGTYVMFKSDAKKTFGLMEAEMLTLRHGSVPGSPKTYFALADANSLQQRKFAAHALLETGVKGSISVLKSTTSTGRWCKANFRQFYDGDARLFGHLYSCVAAATCDGIYASIVGECAWDEDGWSMIQQNCVDFYYSTLPSINSTEWPADVSDIVTNYWSPRVDSRQRTAAQRLSMTTSPHAMASIAHSASRDDDDDEDEKECPTKAISRRNSETPSNAYSSSAPGSSGSQTPSPASGSSQTASSSKVPQARSHHEHVRAGHSEESATCGHVLCIAECHVGVVLCLMPAVDWQLPEHHNRQRRRFKSLVTRNGATTPRTMTPGKTLSAFK